MTLDEAKNAVKSHDELIGQVSAACSALEKLAHRNVKLPLDKGDVWVLRHGIVYPSHGISIVGEDEATAKIVVPAWDGYDGEPFDNTTVELPFNLVGKSEDELNSMFQEREVSK